MGHVSFAVIQKKRFAANPVHSVTHRNRRNQ
jgi:hypothetical protein